MKIFSKNTLCALYKYSGAMTAQERVAYWTGRRFGAILLFHRVTDVIPHDGLTVSTRFFRDLCGILRDRFHVVPLSELCRQLRAGRLLSPRTVAITFDDCYYDNLPAAQVLADHGLPACFFIPTRYVGTDHVFEWDKSLPRMANLSWADIHTMLQLGHEIGSHTVTHADLGAIGPEEARQELRDSRRELEDRLQRPIRWLACPYGMHGNFRPEYLPLVYEAGYDAAFSAYGGFVEPRQWGRQVLRREPVPCFHSLLNLELHLTGCLDWFYGLKRRVGIIS